MTFQQIRNKFNDVYNGQPNFLTPYFVNVGKRGRLLWELTSGEALGGGAMYGVTVIEIDGTKRHDLSGSFDSRQAADDYIRNDFQKEIAA